MKKYDFEYCMKHKCDSCKNWIKCESREKSVRRNRKSEDKKNKHNRFKAGKI